METLVYRIDVIMKVCEEEEIQWDRLETEGVAHIDWDWSINYDKE